MFKLLLHMANFNVRTSNQIGQQDSLGGTPETFRMVVYCVSKTHTQDPTSMITFCGPHTTSPSCFTLRLSGDLVSSGCDQVGVGIVLSIQMECTLLQWILVNGHLCAVRFNDSVHDGNGLLGQRCLFVLAVYAPTDCSSGHAKGKFIR